MPDREKVIDGLEKHITTIEASGDGHKWRFVQVEIIEAALKLLKGQTASDWVSVKERMPDSGKHVLLTCEIRCIDGFKKRYVCDGFYSKAHTLPQGHYPEDDEAYDYDEDEDEYYLKEGWYEVIHNWDDYSSVVIYDFVTHWRPLPEPAQEESDERTD